MAKVQRIAITPRVEGLVFDYDWSRPLESLAIEDRALAYYLAQLEEEGYTVRNDGVCIPWEDLYRLRQHPEHKESLSLLRLPDICAWKPKLASRGALDEADFAIYLDGWITPDGTQVRVEEVERVGGFLRYWGEVQLLEEATWRLLEAVKTFAQRPAAERNRDSQFRAWGRIRALAMQAGANLNRFLATTIVLVPEKLRLKLRRTETAGIPVMEVIPTFDEEPPDWLAQFDRYATVPARYDVSLAEGGIAHVIVEPRVQKVLAEIKRMSGRRIAGQRAEAFLRNPYAVIGEEAVQVLPSEDFETELCNAGIDFYTFRLKPVRRAGLIECVEVVVDSACGDAKAFSLLDPEELEAFLSVWDRALREERPCFDWQGLTLELRGADRLELDRARSLWAEWTRAHPLEAKEIFDLSNYSPRVEAIGQAKPVYSPYIAPEGEKGGWLPDRIEFGIAFQPEGSDRTILLPFLLEDWPKFREKLEEAEAQGKQEFIWPGLPGPIALRDARRLRENIEAALGDIRAGKWDNISLPTSSRLPSSPVLLIAHNIEKLDYTEQRTKVLRFEGADPLLPTTLCPQVKLLAHQRYGIAWLQHLWRHCPEYVRGCLLADDMGLGKTLQLLVFLAWLFEKQHVSEPVLVVAPIALLDNWQEEIKRFFKPDAFGTICPLYGDGLQKRRLPANLIDGELQKQGLRRFLQPDWRQGARLVLTSYETLRDYQFDLGRQDWSVMICDEAQKIKSPAALVTQAAKAMRARFKIAVTGTPVENSLTDLWCLFDFIQPGLLGALNEFGRRYKRPIEARTEQEQKAVEELQSLIRPQILRRTKQEVAKDLPPKIEDVGCRTLPISAFQRNLYAQVIQAHRASLNDPDSSYVQRAMLGVLHRLRQICAHPVPMGQIADLSLSLEEAQRASPKLAWLLNTLDSIRQRNEKAIIFTEVREIQRVLQHYLGERFGIRPVIVNGDTDADDAKGRSRKNLIDAFQSRDGFDVIILSPLAVGFGLNIQAANHVIHYTRLWNPAKEDQATDRAWRIGQTKEVRVYYPTVHAEDFVTFEKRLDQLLTAKRELAARTWLNGSDEVRIGEFDLKGPDGEPVFEDTPIGELDLARMTSDALEKLCVLLWLKQGYRSYRTPSVRDFGVDVVAICGQESVLIQCKSSSQEKQLGWEGIKDVVGGREYYQKKHPGVDFKLMVVTNQFFNDTAKEQAEINSVILIDQQSLCDLLAHFPIKRSELL